jgi:hypothetical protein
MCLFAIATDHEKCRRHTDLTVYTSPHSTYMDVAGVGKSNLLT